MIRTLVLAVPLLVLAAATASAQKKSLTLDDGSSLTYRELLPPPS